MAMEPSASEMSNEEEMIVSSPSDVNVADYSGTLAANEDICSRTITHTQVKSRAPHR